MSSLYDGVLARFLPTDVNNALLVGRVWREGDGLRRRGPVPVIYRDGALLDASRLAQTTAQLLMRQDLVEVVRSAALPSLGDLRPIAANSFRAYRDPSLPWLLAPCDLQPVKACGVTYIASILERLVEERSGGSAAGIEGARAELEILVGGSLVGLRPGSPEADRLKQELIRSGRWSHYLEVAIGPDAESFSKCPPMAAVGFGSDVGVRSDSHWNNPEPELVLAVRPDGVVVGVTLGNDVNLRDFEGRSPMLLDKAKDNNASAAIGPFIRIFDSHYRLSDAAAAKIGIEIIGVDGYETRAQGNVSDITRSLEGLVAQVIGAHHNYPDGLMLFTGTMWAPPDDRAGAGSGFYHLDGDHVVISEARIGALCNRTRPAHLCDPWDFGLAALLEQGIERGDEAH